MIPDFNRNFLYEDIANLIRGRIEDGYYEPGSRIPSVPTLATELKVSEITIRRAIRDLTLEGILKSRPRLGYFVTKNSCIIRHLGDTGLVPLEQDMQRIGLEPAIQELALSLVPAAGWCAEALQVESDCLIYRIDRLNLASGEPVSIDSMWFSRAVGDELLPALRDNFIATALRQTQIQLHEWSYAIEAAAGHKRHAELLLVPTGFPMLKLRYYGNLRSQGSIIVGETIARSDRFNYQIAARPQ
jgi:GntR family transcriptional regulator